MHKRLIYILIFLLISEVSYSESTILTVFLEPLLSEKIYSFLSIRDRYNLVQASSTEHEIADIYEKILLDIIFVISKLCISNIANGQSRKALSMCLQQTYSSDFTNWYVYGAKLENMRSYIPAIAFQKRNIESLIYYSFERYSWRFCGILTGGSAFYAFNLEDASNGGFDENVCVAPNLASLFKELLNFEFDEILTSHNISSEEKSLLILANETPSDSSERIMMMFESHFYNLEEEVQSVLEQLNFERTPISGSERSSISYIN